jgi:hypothetical protein
VLEQVFTGALAAVLASFIGALAWNGARSAPDGCAASMIHKSTDLFEDATDCGSNVWKNNDFLSANRVCIQ